MEFNIGKQNNRNLVFQRNILLVLFIVSLFICLMQSVVIVTKDNKTIVIPTNLTKEISVSDYSVSRSYIEEMSNFFLSFLLDLTPSNINYKSDIILRHISADFYQEMKGYFTKEIAKYKEYALLTTFNLSELEIDEKALKVRAKGQLITYFGKTGFKQEPVIYQIKYIYKGSKLLISKFGLERIKEEGVKDA